MDSLLSYFGGKTYLAPFIASRIPPGFECYCEPFCGSAAVFFAAPGRWANSEVLNDINHDLINLFHVMQNDEWRQELLDLLEVTPFARDQWREAQQGVRHPETWDKSGQPVWRAWAYFVSHAQAFNIGGHSFRVPMVGKDLAGEWNNRIERLGYPPLIARLKQACLENKSFEKLIPALDSKYTFFYIDPPYIGATDQASMKSAYSGFSLSKEQDELLIEMVKSIRGGVILSGYARDDLPADWIHLTIDVPVHARYVKGETAKKRTIEHLWINPRAQVVRLL
jgi:DNA adenine methylase